MTNINTYYTIKLSKIQLFKERGIVMKKKLIILLLLVVVVISLGSVASAADRSNVGTLNGYKWTTRIEGNAAKCRAVTTYARPNYGVNVSLTAKYTGADFIGTRSISRGTGGIFGASTTINIPSGPYYRFVEANSRHTISTITDRLSITIK